jgi:nucleoside-diphosphate-sugar epimerase
MSLKGKKIGVTGATGFLGPETRSSCSGHCQESRQGSALKNLPIEFRKADLGDRDSLAKAFEGLDAVVSNAAQIGARDFAEMVSNNVGGTENVIEAMHTAGVKRCLMVSSGGVYKRKGLHAYFTEESELRSEHDPVNFFSAYMISKAMGETRGWELCNQYGIELTTVRPFGIFGAFDSGTFSMWFNRIMKLPVTPFPFGVDVSLSYAGDIAEAICMALENPVSVGKAYNISGGKMDIWTFFNIWKQAGGKHSWLRIPFPLPFRLMGSNALARRELGWRPSPVVEACREILAAEARGSHWESSNTR